METCTSGLGEGIGKPVLVTTQGVWCLSYPLNSNSTSSDARVAASDAYYIIKSVINAPKSVQIAFLSGTIHPDSAKNFADYINKNFGRHIEVIKTKPGDPEAINKTQLRVIPDDSIRDEKILVNMASKWINSGETGNAIIMFSKKKINDLVKKIIQKVAPNNLIDISNRKPPNRYENEQIARYERSLKVQGYTSREIEKLVDQFKKDNFSTNQADIINRIKNKPGANLIKNTELRYAVAYGIGYIYRQDPSEIDEQDRQMGIQEISENDKLIVANLFSTGKINLLIATPSIGVGVNVSIRNMYLPTLYKFERTQNSIKGQMSINNKREMSQLVNRAGRGVTPVSGIYTPKEFVPYMMDIISMTPTDHPIVDAIPISINPDTSLIDVIIKLNESISPKIKKMLDNITYNMKPGVAWNRFTSDIHLFITQYVHKIRTGYNDYGKNINELKSKTQSIIQRTKFELDTQNRSIQFSSSNDILDNLEKYLEKHQDIVFSIMEHMNQLNVIRKNIPSYNQPMLDMKLDITIDIIQLHHMLISIENSSVNMIYDGYKTLSNKIDETTKDLQRNPNDWKLRQDHQQIQQIINKITKKWNFFHSKITLQKYFLSLLENLKNEIVSIENQISELRNSNNSQSKKLIPDVLKLRDFMIKYKIQLNNKINEIQSLRR